MIRHILISSFAGVSVGLLCLFLGGLFVGMAHLMYGLSFFAQPQATEIPTWTYRLFWLLMFALASFLVNLRSGWPGWFCMVSTTTSSVLFAVVVLFLGSLGRTGHGPETRDDLHGLLAICTSGIIAWGVTDLVARAKEKQRQGKVSVRTQ